MNEGSSGTIAKLSSPKELHPLRRSTLCLEAIYYPKPQDKLAKDYAKDRTQGPSHNFNTTHYYAVLFGKFYYSTTKHHVHGQVLEDVATLPQAVLLRLVPVLRTLRASTFEGLGV